MNGSAGTSQADAPLKGIRVADLAQAWAGAYATQILGDLGAEVVKVESLSRPDPWRGGLSAYQRGTGAPGNRPYNRNALTNSVCRNKVGLTLDLNSERGRALFLRLVAVSDIVVENFTPRVMGNFRLSFETLAGARPNLIMLSMPGYGDRGPYADYLAIGGSIEPMSANSSLLGPPEGPPLNSGAMYPDPVAGLFGAAAVLLALQARASAVGPQYLNLSQQESMIALMGSLTIEAGLRSEGPRRLGDEDPVIVPSRHLRCRDGRFVAITIQGDRDWAALAALLGRPELGRDPRYATAEARLLRRAEVDRLLDGWCAEQDAAEVERQLVERGIAAGLARTMADVAACPQLRARGFFQTVPHAELGAFETGGLPWRLSETPASIRHGPPCLGEHSRQILRDLLGLPPDEILHLEAAGVTGDQPPDLEASDAPPRRG